MPESSTIAARRDLASGGGECSGVIASRESYRSAFQVMLQARTFEDKVAAQYRAGKVVGGVYLGRGQEAFSTALGIQLHRERGDVFSGLIRDQSGKLAFGESLIDAARTYFGSASGPMRGRDGNIHRGRPREGMPAMISHLGTSISVVNGMLLAKRFRGETGFVGGATCGDGATSTGSLHEGLNQAAVERVPLVLAVANNQFAYSTPTTRQYACADLVDRALGYGITGYSVDGTDLAACLEVFAKAISEARNGGGPQLVVGKLLRLAGHGEHDDARYVPETARAGRWGRDCLIVARERLLADGWASEAEIEAWENEAQSIVESTVAQAQSEPTPDPSQDNWQAISCARLREGSE